MSIQQTSQSGASSPAAPAAEARPFATQEDIKHIDLPAAIGEPGRFPYVRGVHRTMYRERLWTMRQFAGFGSAEQTNARFKFLLDKGQTGLSTAFDLPTLMGRDSDDPLALGEVGKCGVAIACLDDMRRLFDGIDLGQVSTSMTINAPAAILLAFYVCVAQDQGVPLDQLRGTLQNDILKEFHAQNEFVFPPPESVNLVVDTIEYCTAHMPRWNTVSISGYHIREAGATAAQEMAFTLADGMCYVEKCLERGLDVDAFAPRLSFFFDVHNDFFEEIAKFRAARRIWAHHMRDEVGAKNERSWLLRVHSQTAGVSLTEQQPMNNVVRVAYQALAAVLGGTQSLHTNSMDETLALPTEEAVKLALRTQQILAYETNVTQTVDPLGGSWFVEALTEKIEREGLAIIDRIRKMGGVLAAIDRGYFRRSIAESSMAESRRVEAGESIIVGVNAFRDENEKPIEILQIGSDVAERQQQQLAGLRRQRDGAAYRAAIDRLIHDARRGTNVMEALIQASRAGATVGEMMRAMQSVYGTYDGGPEW